MQNKGLLKKDAKCIFAFLKSPISVDSDDFSYKIPSFGKQTKKLL